MLSSLKKHINIPFLFFLSGISGLIYETVWFRMLIRVFGTTLEATSTILAVFMGGLALGAWLIGKKADNFKNPLKVYAFIEIFIGIFAAGATLLMAQLPQLLANILPTGDGLTIGILTSAIRVAIAAGILLPPTILMGATLPLLTQHLSANTSEAGGNLSKLYALNTFGAVAGVLASGFILIGHAGETATVLLAAALNMIIAARIFTYAPTAMERGGKHTEQIAAESMAGYKKLAWILGLSGFAALAIEVLWARTLVVTIGNSVYAFSAMLGTYLTGIAIGSLAAERRIQNMDNPFYLLAKTQTWIATLALIGLAVFWFLGLRTMDPKYLYSPLVTASDLLNIFGWSLLIILPVTLLMGFFFPIAVQAGVKLSGRIGGAVGALYGANTLGTILGSLAAGFILIPTLGTKFSFIFIAIVMALTSVLLATMTDEKTKVGFAKWLVAPVVVAFLAFFIPDPISDIIERRFMANSAGITMYHNEDKVGAVTLRFDETGKGRSLFINGFAVSGNGSAGKVMAHFPLLFQKDPKEMFIIGLGVGNTLRSGVLHGAHVDVAELLSSVVETGMMFTPYWKEMRQENKFRILLGDGRNELLKTKKSYDAIIVDVTPPIYSSGAVNVYSKDFFQIAHKRLSPNGVLSLWIPKPCFVSDYLMILKSLKAVFPYVNVWEFPSLPGFLALGSNNELNMDPKILAKRIKEGRVNEELKTVTPELIAKRRILTDKAVGELSAAYPAVTDDHPYTEFPLARFLSFSPRVQ